MAPAGTTPVPRRIVRGRARCSRTLAARLIADLRPSARAVASRIIDIRHAAGAVDLIGRYTARVPALPERFDRQA